MKSNEEWSSQLSSQFLQLRKEAWKKNSGLQRGLNPWPHDTGATLYQLSYHIRSSHMIFFICIIHSHIFHGNIWTQNWPAPNVSGFIAQLVERRTGIARSRVQAPLKSRIFFRLLYAIVKIAIITARIILHLISYPQFTYDLFHMHHPLIYRIYRERNRWNWNSLWFLLTITLVFTDRRSWATCGVPLVGTT